MAADVEVVEGTTAPLDFELLDGGSTPETSMAGMTVELCLADRDGRPIPTSGNVTVTDVNAWLVRYSPDSTDLTPGVFHGRFRVTDSDGKVDYFPMREWLIWEVRSVT